MRDIIAVIAGNYREYIEFLKEHSLSTNEAKYIKKASDLSGHYVKDVEFVGSYCDNSFFSHPYRDFILQAHKPLRRQTHSSFSL